MATTPILERAAQTRLVAISFVDELARALGSAGPHPPPKGDIVCRIVQRSAPVPRAFEPPLVLWTLRNPSGFLLMDGTYQDLAGERLPLADGRYLVHVESPYYRTTADFELIWPAPPETRRVPLDLQGDPIDVSLLPRAAYPMPDVTLGRFQLGPTVIRGTMLDRSGRPIAGAKVAVVNLPLLTPAELPALAGWPFLESESDDHGDWAVVLPGRRYIDPADEVPAGNPPAPLLRKTITVQVTYPGGPIVNVPEDVELGTEHTFRNTALRGQVLGPHGQPVAGARIETTIGPASAVSRGDGVWFLYFDLNQADVPNVTVTATTPGGAQASDSSASIKRRSTIVVPTFRFP